MDKENGEDPAAKPPPDGLLDPSGLFGAYWGREGASAAQAQAQAQAALFGFGSRYPPPTTLGVAANQAASLSLHPAASAAWWSMASHLAAQDYLARLQASGLSFPPLGDPYAALSALAAGKHKQKTQRNDGRSGRGSSAKEKPPATSTSSQPTIPDWGSSYGFPPSSTPSGSLSSLASLNSLAQQPHSKHKPPTNRKSSSASKEKESRDLMLAHSAYHAALTKGKGMSSLYPFGTPDKDRRGIDSFTGLPHTILSAALEGGDPSSVLGGVRLPPDTEIIKYTSSLAGPKLAPGSTTRGRKKTISLDPPRVSVHPASPAAPPTPNKRQKVDEFGNSRSSVEVIRLPSKPDRNNVPTPPPNLSDYAGISRELLQTIASQSGVSLAALERQLQPANNEPGLNLSTKSANNSEDTPLDLGLKDEDTPLNLSLKPTPPNTQASDALSRLTSLSSSLSASNDRISRRKPGAKPRRVAPDAHDSPRPKSSGSEDSESLPTWPSREGRPRNLGRGVSKPKKNTVASLLAQSRALGLRPALAQQLLAETDIDKLRVLLGETASTDSECPSDSNPSDSDTSDGGKRSNDPQLRLPLALGWKRVTVIKGLSRNCNIKGDVSYTPPEPNTGITIRTADELNAFLESNPSAPLSRDSFSFSARVLLGEYVQHTHEEPVVMTETEITKRLEEARALAALSGRPTPPPLERRMELARRQQAARDARRDGRGRDQARLVREIERSEKAEVVKREKEARSAQLLEAKKRKQEELEKQKMEDQAKRQQEREIKRQQAMLLKEQERERRRQHTAFIRQLDARRRWEDRERRKHQNLLDRLLAKEKKLQQRRKEMELLAELRRPQEDSSLSDHKPLPKLDRIPGLRIPGQAMADLLQVYEFLHNFGQALGFEVESLPTLDTLQMGLIPTCSQEAEDELMSVLTKLLVVAIEEPGIPHPGRHTTLLGHALRLAELTPDTLSEVLRIYLYACATAEVKALTGLTVERERDRRVADHHQSDAEMQMTFASSKNTTYYEHLHSNATYKLSELLRDKPFASLPPSSKCRMMARVCDELLQSRSVLRQLDSSLEHLAQLRRDRYLLDTRIRKVRVLQQRKARAEAAERQQAAALDRMHRMVDDSHTHAHETEDKPETPKKESSPDKQHTPSPFKDESDKELSPLKDLSKKMLNNNKDDDVKDKDDVMADCDGLLSDLESEGTQPEEDEDKNLSSEELSRKLEKLLRQSEQQLLALAAGSHELRATCYGQDRYWRRYWSLGKAGGVLVEALESAQPETIDYHDRRERAALAKEDTLNSDNPDPESVEVDAEAEAQELRSIKNELNLSDRTQIIKYEPNVTHGVCKVEGSIKMEEKYIQHKQSNEEEDMLDIEDSIPTAFLVQKPTHKPMFAQQAEQIDKPQEIVKVENIVKSEAEQEEEKENTVNNLEELRKMAEAVSSELNAAKKAEADKIEMEAKMEETKQAEVESAHSVLYTKMLEGKWFSILRHESSFLNDINDKHDIAVFCDNEHTCSEVINCQGHKWDVSNNLHLLNDPSLFTLNSMVTSVQVPANNVYADSSLTMSGIDQDELDSSLGKDAQDVDMEENKELETDVDKEVQSVTKDISQKTKASNLSSLGLLNFNALSTYVTCDSPPPIQMTADELEQLENAKIHGLPKKVEGSYVPKELRHGWWRISRPEQLQELLEALHPRGARERELQAALTQHPPTINNKLYIDPGSPRARLTTPADLSEEGYPPPDTPGSFCALTARRVDMQLLAMVEALEERVAAASMQVKGWRAARLALPAAATGAEIVARARHKLASLEAHIERRYLKPPLVQRYVPDGGRTATESSSEVLGAALQADGTAHSDAQEHKSDKGISRGLCVWREAVSRCNTSAQLAMLLHALEHAVAWDKSIMKANCQFCLSGDNEDQLLLCDGCDKGYHTYCFKPRMEKIPDGDWYCWECVNKARGGSRERVCIVCGGAARGRALPCALCVRAYHLDCHYPPLTKMPRGKWYCSQCASRAPARRPRKGKKDKNKDSDLDGAMVPSPAASHASTSTTAEEGVLPAPEPERDDPDTDGLTHNVSVDTCDESHASGNGALLNDTNSEDHESENLPLLSRAKKEKNSAKKQLKDMQFCKNLLCEMECHEHAWPFLVPVNTKQFPQYRKVIKSPMDLSTIKRKLHESGYKCKEEFASDVRLIFSNCEVFNEDESPVGRAGHCMREFFERRWEHA
ncbi:bromodomain adjacent to zinc finger domain protein 2B isoform X9 [Danaus plexippus]|uniref:bromodomain adjacent to zinc finger domain protein 2B isoform X9 n=1 Tax=Danaus plexippus TaxID=13037 RepID=UPI002AAF471D|nr:bromodomain adjacent to zinc finger domain protein 2B isoform X9 [Danaus plexippus]